jgi:hypothetical protein
MIYSASDQGSMKFSALNRFRSPILSIAAIFAFVSGALAAKVPADVAGVYGGLVVQIGASETAPNQRNPLLNRRTCSLLNRRCSLLFRPRHPEKNES